MQFFYTAGSNLFSVNFKQPPFKFKLNRMGFFHPEAARMAMKPTQNGNMIGALMVKGKPALKCMFQKLSCHFGSSAHHVQNGENFQKKSSPHLLSNPGNVPRQLL